MYAFMAIHSSLTNGIKPLSKETAVLEHCMHDLTIYQLDSSIMNASICRDMHCDMQLRVSEMLGPHGNSISNKAILALNVFFSSVAGACMHLHCSCAPASSS